MREQTAPDIDVVQLAVGVSSLGIERVMLSKLGLAAAIVKGEVMVMVRVDVDSRTRELDGV